MYIAERRVEIEVEYSRTAWLGVVNGVPLVGGSLLGMAWFDVWKGRSALRGIVRMDFG